MSDEELLREALETLERVGCQFWACEGPDAPEVHMKTCFCCSMIKKLRKHLEEKKHEK